MDFAVSLDRQGVGLVSSYFRVHVFSDVSARDRKAGGVRWLTRYKAMKNRRSCNCYWRAEILFELVCIPYIKENSSDSSCPIKFPVLYPKNPLITMNTPECYHSVGIRGFRIPITLLIRGARLAVNYLDNCSLTERFPILYYFFGLVVCTKAVKPWLPTLTGTCIASELSHSLDAIE